jgi:hypothetical protein
VPQPRRDTDDAVGIDPAGIPAGVPEGAIPADFLLPTERPNEWQTDRQSPGAPGSGENLGDPGRSQGHPGSTLKQNEQLGGWAIRLILACSAIVSVIGYWFYTGWEKSTSAATVSCHPFGWRTVVYTKESSAELASATLRSNHAIRSKEQESCVDITFACTQSGPYFELLLTSPGLSIKSLDQITGGTLSRLSVVIAEPAVESGSAVRLTNTGTIERIGHAMAIMDFSFTAQLSLSNDESADVRFASFNTASALRPVFFACGLREPSKQDENGRGILEGDR